AHAAHAGVAHRQHQVDVVAQRGTGGARGRLRHVAGGLETGSGRGLPGLALDEAHGRVPMAGKPSRRAGHAGKRPHRGTCEPPRGGSATIFRWTHRSPQDLAPRRSKPQGPLHQVAPASSGLSLSRSRWSAQVAPALPECQSLYRHEAMTGPACRSRSRGSTFRRRVVHTSPMSRPALFGVAAALCLAACTTTAPLTAPAPAASQVPPTVLVPERYVSADNPGDEIDSLATWPTADGRT